MAISKTSGKRIETGKYDAKVLELRSQGWTLREIANYVGTSHTYVHKRITILLKRLAERNLELAASYRDLQLVQLEKLIRLLWQKLDSSEELDLKIIDRLLRTLEREAKLLGLDRPAKLAVTDVEGKQSELSKLSDYELLQQIFVTKQFQLEDQLEE